MSALSPFVCRLGVTCFLTMFILEIKIFWLNQTINSSDIRWTSLYLDLNVSHFGRRANDGPPNKRREDVLGEVGACIAALNKLKREEQEKQGVSDKKTHLNADAVHARRRCCHPADNTGQKWHLYCDYWCFSATTFMLVRVNMYEHLWSTPVFACSTNVNTFKTCLAFTSLICFWQRQVRLKRAACLPPLHIRKSVSYTVIGFKVKLCIKYLKPGFFLLYYSYRQKWVLFHDVTTFWR